jgi:hypothetical protein
MHFTYEKISVVVLYNMLYGLLKKIIAIPAATATCTSRVI